MGIEKRFDKQLVGKTWYAALSLGSPNMLYTTDYSVFKHTDEEKGTILTEKKKLGKSKHYKFESLVKMAL